MRLILTPILAFHWMAMFLMLTVVSIAIPGRGSLAALELLGVHVQTGPSTDVWPSAILAVGFATVAALFLWTLFTSVFGERAAHDAEQVSRYGFAGGIAAFTLLLLVGAVRDVSGAFTSIGTLLAALIVSYLAILAEHSTATTTESPPEETSVIRRMAVGAAHNAILARLSGRREPSGRTTP